MVFGKRNQNSGVGEMTFGRRKAADMVGAAATSPAVGNATMPEEEAKKEQMIYNFSPDNNETYSYECALIEDNAEKIKVVDDTPDGGLSFGGFGVRSGRPIESDFLPKQIRLSGAKRKINDLYLAYTILVDQTFKDILEELEPGVHQFFPIELIWKDGSHAAHKYWFNPCNRLDSVDREKTTVPFGNIWKPYRGGELIFNRSQIAGCHAWIDKFISGGGVLISDVFAEKLKAAKLSGLSLRPYESVA